MSSALAIDHNPGPSLPHDYGAAEQERRIAAEHPSPLPPEWSNSTKPLRDLAAKIEKLLGH
jgi:hypothetical protein